MTTSDNPLIWPTFRYKDARTAIRWLVEVFDFETVAVHGDGDVVEHAQLRGPLGGGVMLSSAKPEGPLQDWQVGSGGVYVVVDNPDELYERAVAAGTRIEIELRDEDYGSRGFTCRDAEGVFWSFGTYRGE